MSMTIEITVNDRQIAAIIRGIVDDVDCYDADVRKAAGVKINELKAQLAADPDLMEMIQRRLTKVGREAVLSEIDYGVIYGEDVKAVRAADRACAAVLENRSKSERVTEAIDLLSKNGFKVVAKADTAAD